jgi:hypothetical protein
MRPHARRADGARCAGTGANVHPPLPGTRKSVATKRVVVTGRQLGSGMGTHIDAVIELAMAKVQEG